MSEPALDRTALGELVETLLARGLPMRHARGLDSELLDGLYQLAHAFYQQSRVEPAESLFRFLCLHDHLAAQHWLGLGACLQARSRHDEAIMAYSRAGLLAPTEPNLPFYVGCCHQALGAYREAERAFHSVVQLAGTEAGYHPLAERAALLARAMAARQDNASSEP